MKLFKRSKRDITSEQPNKDNETTDPLLKAILGSEKVDRSVVMNIPAVSACVNKIGDIISTIQVKMYKRENGKVKEVLDDHRLYLLNHETGDTMDAVQFKKAMITDMYLSKGGYAYVNKVGSEVKSIHYVESDRIAFLKNTDPIFKDYKIECNGISYEGFQFIKLLRNSVDGMQGKSVISESNTLLSTIYSSQLFEQNLVRTGGNKKGFIESTSRLSKEAMTALKDAFRRLYANNTENVVVLNDGLKFQESSNTSVELQLNENKQTNGKDVCKLFLMPPSIIYGGATAEDVKNFIEQCIIPILMKFETAINSVMLNEDEKDTYFFAFDTDDLLKGDIDKRYDAYKKALDAGFMQLDEVRYKEKLEPYGLNFIKLGLQDVLYYPDKNEIYIPNTNKIYGVGKNDSPGMDEGENTINEEGGDMDEDRG